MRISRVNALRVARGLITDKSHNKSGPTPAFSGCRVASKQHFSGGRFPHQSDAVQNPLLIAIVVHRIVHGATVVPHDHIADAPHVAVEHQ